MLAFSQREDVGAVGAKLYYPDGRIQHAGLIIGLGGHIASHYDHTREGTYAGYMNRLLLPQNYSAVTGSCLMVKKKLYLQAGGLDDINFSVALNDVDFCLKLIDMGKVNVLTPFAELLHHESKSRGLDTTPEKAARFEKERSFFISKWPSYFRCGDPYHNKSLTW
jgi:GT2 family glycosyltransferase